MESINYISEGGGGKDDANLIENQIIHELYLLQNILEGSLYFFSCVFLIIVIIIIFTTKWRWNDEKERRSPIRICSAIEPFLPFIFQMKEHCILSKSGSPRFFIRTMSIIHEVLSQRLLSQIKLGPI